MAWNDDGKYHTTTPQDVKRAKRFVTKREKIKALALTDPKAWNPSLWNLAGSQSLSGETVTESTALTLASIWNANVLISGTIGSLPLHLMQQDGDKKLHFTDSSLYSVLHSRYNPYMTAMAGRELLASHALMWGNGYAEKVLDGLGRIVELWPIPPDRVTPELVDGKPVYRIRFDGEADKTLSREQILHIPGLGFDGFIGYSVISMARKSIGLGMALDSFGSLYFGQGTHLGGILTHPNRLSKEAKDNLSKTFDNAYKGLSGAHRAGRQQSCQAQSYRLV